MTVIDYVSEEVRRQGHDTSELDGIQRVGWMLDAWSYALQKATNTPKPLLEDAIKIGTLVERVRNKKGVRHVGVRVGWRVCPSPADLSDLLDRLFSKIDDLPPIEFYKEFELIHPFVDGNGRTGKVLLNWLNGSLYDPVFPPADLFGDPIINP